MSDTETFLSRWLRLKSVPGAELPSVDAPSPTPFDPASLPTLDSIVADTDMQQFMHEAVPEELTRAALRSAWTADPAIRDFVGIAENQWNFNDHTSIPGFGPIEAADYLATQALQSLTNAGWGASPEAESAGQTERADGKVIETVQPAAVPPSRDEIITEVATTIPEEECESESAVIAAAAPRAHGGALPK
jgi:hypothetical protein